MSFSKPKVPKPKALPTPPTLASITSIVSGGSDAGLSGFSSLINTGPSGLARKGLTKKKSLLGQ